MLIPLTLGLVIRSVVAFLLHILLPSSAILTLLHDNEQHLHLLERLALSLGLSVALNSVIAYGVHFVGGTLTHYSWSMILFGVIGLLALFVQCLKGELRILLSNVKALLITGLVLLISVLWFGVILQNGPLITYDWDQLFHIAHAREALETHRVVPKNPLWEDVSLSETYGAWHPLLASVAHTADVDLWVIWRVGNALMAGFSVIVMYTVANWVIEDPLTSLLAAVVFLASGVGFQQIMRTFIYPWGVSYFCMWMGLGSLFRYLKTGGRRWALLAALLGLTPIAIHPQEFVFFYFGAFMLGAAAFVMRICSGQSRIELRRIWLFCLVLILIGLPLVLIKYPTRAVLSLNVTGVVDNSEPTSRLYTSPLAKVLAVAFPYFGKAGALFVNLKSFNMATLLLLWFLPKSLDPKARWFLIIMTCAPLLFAVVPGFSWLATLVLRETYAWRLLNLVPTFIVWASVIVDWLAVRKHQLDFSDERQGAVARYWPWVYVGLAVGLLGVLAFSLMLIVRRDNLVSAAWIESPLKNRTMFEYLDRASDQRAVVLSDPKTSYAVPALTKHRVVLNEPSHGSRDDIVTRFGDARALLSSPSQSPEDAWAILQQYDVYFILINKAWVGEQFFTMTDFYAPYTLDFLRNNTACFELLYDDPTFELFNVVNTCVPADIVDKGRPRQEQISLEELEYPLEKRFAGNLSLLGFSLPAAETIVPGRTLRVDIYWQAEQRIVKPYFTMVELLGDYPGRELPYGRLLRKVQAWTQDRSLAVRAVDWFSIPPLSFQPGDVFVQCFELEVPSNFIQTPGDLSVYVLNKEQVLSGQRVLPIFLMENQYIHPGLQLQRFPGEEP